MDDLRNHVIQSVLARRPVDQRERESIAAFTERVAALDDPFNEHANNVHITTSAIVLDDDRRRVVLHMHKRLKIWLQPGGHIDRGETPWDAAVREAVEETGLPATLVGTDLLHVDVHPGPRGHTHLDLRYLLTSPPVAPNPPEGESQDVQWFHWRKAISSSDVGLEGILRALQPGEATLRPVRASDATECAQVYLRSRQFGIPDVPCIHERSEVRRWMADEVVGHMDMWVADVDSVVVGQLVLDGDWLQHLYIDPSWMGRGLGDRFIDLAKQRCPGGLQLWAFEVNGPARRFYERHGFEAVEFTDGRGNEERAPDVRDRGSGA